MTKRCPVCKRLVRAVREDWKNGHKSWRMNRTYFHRKEVHQRRVPACMTWHTVFHNRGL